MNSKLKNILNNINNLLFEIEPDTSSGDITGSDDKELPYMHTTLHGLWMDLKKDKIDGWDKNKIINLHKIVVSEMIKREYKHRFLSDLDDTLTPDLKSKTIKTKDAEKENDS